MPFYRKTQLQELVPWTPDLSMDLVSISQADKANGSPKFGDMIAFNPNNRKDMWLVAEQFFKENYEFVTDNKAVDNGLGKL